MRGNTLRNELGVEKILSRGVYYRLSSFEGDGMGRVGGRARNMKEKNLP